MAVLGMVFYAYFESQQGMLFLASSSESSEDLQEKIQKNCQNGLDQILKKERTSFICNVKVKQRKAGGASYTLRTQVTVTRNQSGVLQIEGKGAMRERKRHATEADFCNDCSSESSEVSAEGGLEEVMSQVLDIAHKIYDMAEVSTETARKEYNKKDREKRLAQLRERHCEGKWDKEDQEFREFDLEERLDCKMSRMSEMGLPVEVEEFYHRDLKNELWKTAFSDDSYILEDGGLLEELNDPYRYSFSVRASANLLKNYMHWKDDFEVLDSQREKIAFVRKIKSEVDQITNFMSQEQAQKDRFYLNRGFDGLLARIDRLQDSIKKTTPAVGSPVPAVDYDKVREGLGDL